MTLAEYIQPLLNKRLPAAVVAGLLSCMSPSLAEDHLEPEPSPTSDFRLYEVQDAKEIFTEAFRSDVVARVLVFPSRSMTFMLVLKSDSGAFQLLELQGSIAMGTKHGQPAFEPFAVSGPDGGATIIAPQPEHSPSATKRCEVPIALPLAQRITAVWKRVLLDAHYVDPPSGAADGEAFVFSMEQVHPGDAPLAMSGQYWGGRPPGKLGALIDIVYAMKDYCDGKGQIRSQKLNKQVSNLEKQLR
jgi:hypothetical protein